MIALRRGEWLEEVALCVRPTREGNNSLCCGQQDGQVYIENE